MLKIIFTDKAKEQLKPLVSNHALLKLVFDADGCGCAMDGVPVLWVVNKAQPEDVRAEAPPFQLVYSPKHEVFFDDSMSIDFQPSNNSYILKSNNQIFNAGMSLVDKR